MDSESNSEWDISGVCPPTPKTSGNDAKKRFFIVEELFNTEVSYIKFLLLAQQIYFMPALRRGILSSTEEEVLKKLSLTELVNADRAFVQKLREIIENWDENKTKVANLFFETFTDEFVTIYCSYITNYGEVSKWLKGLNAAAKAGTIHPFLTFLKQQEPLAEQYPLSTLLITPIQRIPRLVLLLKVSFLKFQEEKPRKN